MRIKDLEDWKIPYEMVSMSMHEQTQLMLVTRHLTNIFHTETLLKFMTNEALGGRVGWLETICHIGLYKSKMQCIPWRRLYWRGGGEIGTELWGIKIPS